MRVTIFIVYGGIHVVVHLDGKIERRKSSPYPEWPPGASLGRLAQAGGVEKLQKVQKSQKSQTTLFEKKSGKVFSGKSFSQIFFEKIISFENNTLSIPFCERLARRAGPGRPGAVLAPLPTGIGPGPAQDFRDFFGPGNHPSLIWDISQDPRISRFLRLTY